MATDSRYANGHRRRQVRARVLAEETVCWICQLPVDKTLKTDHEQRCVARPSEVE